MQIRFLIIISILFFSLERVHAIDRNELHPDIIARIYSRQMQLNGQQNKKIALPNYAVCLRHYLSGECLRERDVFFTCDSKSFKEYMECIESDSLANKITEAADKLYEASKKEIDRVRSSKFYSQDEKKFIISKLELALESHREVFEDPEKKKAQIESLIKGRENLIKYFKSDGFNKLVNNVCENNPEFCMDKDQYDQYGKKLLSEFDSRILNADTDPNYPLLEKIKDDWATIEECLPGKMKKGYEKYCKDNLPKNDVLEFVSNEINAGICNFEKEYSKINKEQRELIKLMCDKYYHYIMKLDSEDTNKNNKAMVETKNANSSKNGSLDGWEDGENGGVNHNQEGIFADFASSLVEEEKSKCDSLDNLVNYDCDKINSKDKVSKDATELANNVTKIAKECLTEPTLTDRTLIDASKYLLETQFRAYIDRLNMDKTLSKDQYNQYIDDFVKSCDQKSNSKILVNSNCDYENVVKKQAHEFLKVISKTAKSERKEKEFDSQRFQSQYIEDTLKAVKDVKAIEATLKGLLENFPPPRKPLKEMWPDMPCSTFAGLYDDIVDLWRNSNYDTRCGPIDNAINNVIWSEEEQFYQYYQSVELGLVENVKLKDLPVKRVEHYKKIKSERGNDLAKMNASLDNNSILDKKHASMFLGMSSDTGRILIEPGMISGLESRELECKKKAGQVKKLIQMKTSIMTNYPQLSSNTFSSGNRPSVEWNFWDKNCRGTNKFINTCTGLHTACPPVIRPGCEKKPEDWDIQETPKSFYDMFSDNETDLAQKLKLQLSAKQAESDFNSLKSTTNKICQDPLAAGSEVMRNDKLFKMYASCAVHNIQNGERRDPTDKDEYQYWRKSNNLSKAKELCDKRSDNSINRCKVLQKINSGVWHYTKKAGISAIAPIAQGADIVSCMAMFTGVGGAIYTGARTAITSGALAGAKAGTKFLGTEIAYSLKSMANPVGVVAVGSGYTLADYSADVAESELEKVRARQLSGLATLEDVKKAEEALEAAKRAKSIKYFLLSGALPSRLKNLGSGKGFKLGSTAEDLNPIGVRKIANTADEVPTGPLKGTAAKVAESDPMVLALTKENEEFFLNIAQKYKGKEIGFDEMAEIISSRMGKQDGEAFLRNFRSTMEDLGVKIKSNPKLKSGEGRIKYRLRYIDTTKAQRSAQGTIEWPNAKINTEQDVQKLMSNFIDLYAEAKFTPIRKLRVLLNSPKTFVSQNVKVMADKIQLKMFSLSGDTVLKAGNATDKAAHFAKNILYTLSPSHFFPIKNMKLTAQHIKLFKEKGAQALFWHLYKYESPNLAMLYWKHHVSNLSTLATLAAVPLVAPGALEAYFYFKEKHKLKFESDDEYEKGLKVVANFDQSPKELLDDMEKNIDKLDLSKKEKEEFLKLKQSLEDELGTMDSTP